MSDKQDLYTAISGWIQYIEVGDFSLGVARQQIIEWAAEGDRDMQMVASNLPKLSPCQISRLEELKDLRGRLLKGEVEL